MRIWESSRRAHGKLRIRAELEDAYGEVINMKLITRVRREHGISGLPKHRGRKP
ncbi:MAG: IS3 family transposase [Chloroflexi bacterium]|nr:IS3 family transposase [Chloroflexota bacterium]